jgi:hypothetical protein
MKTIYMEQTLGLLMASGQKETVENLVKQGTVVEYTTENEVLIKYLKIEEDEV